MLAAQRIHTALVPRKIAPSPLWLRRERYLVSCSCVHRLCLLEDAEAFQYQRLAISPVPPVQDSRMMRPQR